jgi:hypothetical protein
MLNKVTLPENYNYIGVFLSLNCNLSCSYCINHTVGLDQRRKNLSGEEWISALNRISSTSDLPISLQGGEPTIHKDFYEIVNGVSQNSRLDLLTNIQFDPYEFMENIPRTRFDRELPYPAIRVSYHPETMELSQTIKKVKILHEEGYSIGLFTVDHPESQEDLKRAREICEDNDLVFKTKEFLGVHDGKVYGSYHYPDSVFQKELSTVDCKTSELLISPEGYVYRCHHDLYNKKAPIGDILSPAFKINEEFTTCTYYGQCNPCDVKLKNNRFQNFGHCSVEIKK